MTLTPHIRSQPLSVVRSVARVVRRGLREPLVHFIVLGVAVFGVYRWVAPPAPSRQIVLSESVIRGLRQDHLRRNGALPTAEEEAALVRRFVDGEVLYREALALGLDRGDIIVRRRLVQKMEFLTEDLEPVPEPTDAELQAYLDAHRDHYAVAARVTLTHVFTSSDRHGAESEAIAAALREQLLAGGDPSSLGDPFLRGREFPQHTERELAAIFGAAFAARVMALPVGGWSEPLRSSYGLHVVQVSDHRRGHEPSVSEVRTTLRQDWREERRDQASRAALDRLRRRYDIRIEGDSTLASSAPGQAAAAVRP